MLVAIVVVQHCNVLHNHNSVQEVHVAFEETPMFCLWLARVSRLSALGWVSSVWCVGGQIVGEGFFRAVSWCDLNFSLSDSRSLSVSLPLSFWLSLNLSHASSV